MSILKRPLITEKMTAASEKLKQYGFVVAKDADKTSIKKAIESLYGVNVVTISTMRYAGKSVTRFTKRGASSGSKPSFKKAVVTLKEGQSINFFENV